MIRWRSAAHSSSTQRHSLRVQRPWPLAQRHQLQFLSSLKPRPSPSHLPWLGYGTTGLQAFLVQRLRPSAPQEQWLQRSQKDTPSSHSASAATAARAGRAGGHSMRVQAALPPLQWQVLQPSAAVMLCPPARPARAAVAAEAECEEGVSFWERCNHCSCGANGRKRCTKKACNPVVPYPNHGKCEGEGLGFKDERNCNWCRCANGQGLCTLRLCL